MLLPWTDCSQIIALDPHAPVGETFAFVKMQHDAEEAPFVVGFYQDAVHTAEALESVSEGRDTIHTAGELGAIPGQDTVHAAEALESVSDQDTTHTAETLDSVPGQDTRLQPINRDPSKPKSFRWAVSKRSGRPHPKDSWELELTQGQKVKVWADLGRNWHVVEGEGGVRGWVHGTWLAFSGSRVDKDARSTYQRFQADMRTLLVPDQLRDFPPLRDYMGECADAACRALREDARLGVCVHGLRGLLRGSGCYSYEWLKEERNVWHPDKFARYCRAEYKEGLKGCAQEVFVLYGVLMDGCEDGGHS